MHCVQALWAPVAPQHTVTALAVGDNSNCACYTGSDDGSIISWQQSAIVSDNVTPGSSLEPVLLLQHHEHPVVAMLAGLSDGSGSYLVSVDCEGWVCLWEVTTWTCLGKQRAAPLTAAATPKILLLPDQEHICIVIPATPWQQQQQPPVYQDHSLCVTAHSPMMLVFHWRTLTLVAAPLVAYLGTAVNTTSITATQHIKTDSSSSQQQPHVADDVVAVFAVCTAPALAPTTADTVVLTVTSSGIVFGGSLAGNRLEQAWTGPLVTGGSSAPIVQGCFRITGSSSDVEALFGSSTSPHLHLHLLLVQPHSWCLLVCSTFSNSTGMPAHWKMVVRQQYDGHVHMKGSRWTAGWGRSQQQQQQRTIRPSNKAVQFSTPSLSSSSDCSSADSSDADQITRNARNIDQDWEQQQPETAAVDRLMMSDQGAGHKHRSSRRHAGAAAAHYEPQQQRLLGGLLLVDHQSDLQVAASSTSDGGGGDAHSTTAAAGVSVVIWTSSGAQEVWGVNNINSSSARHQDKQHQQQQSYCSQRCDAQHSQQQHSGTDTDTPQLLQVVQLQPWLCAGQYKWQQQQHVMLSTARCFTAVDPRQCNRYALLLQHQTSSSRYQRYSSSSSGGGGVRDDKVSWLAAALQSEQQQQQCVDVFSRLPQQHDCHLYLCDLLTHHHHHHYQDNHHQQHQFVDAVSLRCIHGSMKSPWARSQHFSCNTTPVCMPQHQHQQQQRHHHHHHRQQQHHAKSNMSSNMQFAVDSSSINSSRKRPAEHLQEGSLTPQGGDGQQQHDDDDAEDVVAAHDGAGCCKHPRTHQPRAAARQQQSAAVRLKAAVQDLQQQKVSHLLLVGSDMPSCYQVVVMLQSGTLLFYDLATYCVPGSSWLSDCCHTAAGHQGPVTTALEIRFRCPPRDMIAADTAAAAAAAAAAARASDSPSGSSEHKLQQQGVALDDAVTSVYGVSVRPECGGVIPMLLTGGSDGSVRGWDLRLQHLGQSWLAAHPHTAPVDRILLPPCCSRLPWSCCVLSVCTAGVVAISSLATGATHRTLNGWSLPTSPPTHIAWSANRCVVAAGGVDAGGEFHAVVWDVYSGQMDRCLVGAAAHVAMAAVTHEVTSSSRHFKKLQQQQQQHQAAAAGSAATVMSHDGFESTTFGSRMEVVDHSSNSSSVISLVRSSRSDVLLLDINTQQLMHQLEACTRQQHKQQQRQSGKGRQQQQQQGLPNPISSAGGSSSSSVVSLSRQASSDLLSSAPVASSSIRAQQHFSSPTPPSAAVGAASADSLGSNSQQLLLDAVDNTAIAAAGRHSNSLDIHPLHQRQAAAAAVSVAVQVLCLIHRWGVDHQVDQQIMEIMMEVGVTAVAPLLGRSKEQQQQQQQQLDQLVSPVKNGNSSRSWPPSGPNSHPPQPLPSAAAAAYSLPHQSAEHAAAAAAAAILPTTASSSSVSCSDDQTWQQQQQQQQLDQLVSPVKKGNSSRSWPPSGPNSHPPQPLPSAAAAAYSLPHQSAEHAAAAAAALLPTTASSSSVSCSDDQTWQQQQQRRLLYTALLDDPPLLQSDVCHPCLCREVLLDTSGAVVAALPHHQQQQMIMVRQHDDDCLSTSFGVLLSASSTSLTSRLLMMIAVSRWCMTRLHTPAAANAFSSLITLYAATIPHLMQQHRHTQQHGSSNKQQQQQQYLQSSGSSSCIADLPLLASVSVTCGGLLAESAQLLLAALMKPAAPGTYPIPGTQQQQQAVAASAHYLCPVFNAPGSAAAASCWPPAVMQLAVLHHAQQQQQQQQVLSFSRLPEWLPLLVLSAAAAAAHPAAVPHELLAAVAAVLLDVLLGAAPAAASCTAAAVLCDVLHSSQWSVWRPYLGKPAYLMQRLCGLIDQLQQVHNESNTSTAAAALHLQHSAAAAAAATAGRSSMFDSSRRQSVSDTPDNVAIGVCHILAEQPSSIAAPAALLPQQGSRLRHQQQQMGGLYVGSSSSVQSARSPRSSSSSSNPSPVPLSPGTAAGSSTVTSPVAMQYSRNIQPTLQQQQPCVVPSPVNRCVVVKWLRCCVDVFAGLALVDTAAVINELTMRLADPSSDVSSSLALVLSGLARLPASPAARHLLLPHLGLLAAAAAQALDPARPALRHVMTNPVSLLIREMTQAYTQVAWHSGTLQLAVGSTRPLGSSSKDSSSSSSSSSSVMRCFVYAGSSRSLLLPGEVVMAAAVAVFDMNGGTRRKVLLLPVLLPDEQQQQHGSSQMSPQQYAAAISPAVSSSTKSQHPGDDVSSAAYGSLSAAVPVLSDLPAALPEGGLGLWAAAEGVDSAAAAAAAGGGGHDSSPAAEGPDALQGSKSSSRMSLTNGCVIPGDSNSSIQHQAAGDTVTEPAAAAAAVLLRRSSLTSNTLTRAEAAMIQHWFGGTQRRESATRGSFTTAAAAGRRLSSSHPLNSSDQSWGVWLCHERHISYYPPSSAAADQPLVTAADVCGGVSAVAFSPSGEATAALIDCCHCLVVWKINSTWTQRISIMGSSRPQTHQPHAYIPITLPPAAAAAAVLLQQQLQGGDAAERGVGDSCCSWQLQWHQTGVIDVLLYGRLCVSVEVHL